MHDVTDEARLFTAAFPLPYTNYGKLKSILHSTAKQEICLRREQSKKRF